MFFYTFKKFYSSIELNNKNFRNFKSKGGGCYNDMSVYAFKCIDLFFKKILKKNLFKKKKI